MTRHHTDIFKGLTGHRHCGTYMACDCIHLINSVASSVTPWKKAEDVPRPPGVTTSKSVSSLSESNLSVKITPTDLVTNGCSTVLYWPDFFFFMVVCTRSCTHVQEVSTTTDISCCNVYLCHIIYILDARLIELVIKPIRP